MTRAISVTVNGTKQSRNVEAAQKFLTLIFVDLHTGSNVDVGR